MAETEDGTWIKVRYLKSADDPSLAGTEDIVGVGEVEVLLGMAIKGSWGEKVTVIVHYRREDEDFGGGYEATTITGVPYNVIVTGGDEDSAEGALSHLLSGLEAFGFRGSVAVENATIPGHVERYEVDVSD